jgi:hypothetical protein
MRNQMNRRTGATLFCGTLMSLLFLVGCGSSQTAQIPDNAVQVVVTDNHIEMPASVPMGQTTFEVVNAGTQPHNLGITGPAGDTMMDKALKPGETGTLKVSLDTGTYRVYSPSGGEQMQIALIVMPEAAQDGRG